ncbi:MAG: hypothetical protein M1820_002408 [Bogoriella megaspora]|nr:MAG: hypothetical protein M1820_002408 [Bogoriella megaspora]
MRPYNAPSHDPRGSSEYPTSPDRPMNKTDFSEGENVNVSDFDHQPPPPPPLSPPVRRKPLPVNASPVATRFSIPDSSPPNPRVQSLRNPQRSASLDSPRPPEYNDTSAQDFALRDLDTNSGSAKHVSISNEYQAWTPPPRSASLTIFPVHETNSNISHTQDVSRNTNSAEREGQGDSKHMRTQTMSSNHSPPLPKLSLRLNGAASDYATDATDSDYENGIVSKQPVSPAQKFTSFFGWKPQQLGAYDSPTTTFSEKSLSPTNYSNGSIAIDSFRDMPARTAPPPAIDIPKANGPTSYFNVPGTPLLSSSPSINAHVEELERELREVSAELAGSIRREMELEDEIERWKSEQPFGNSDAGRRTSDYYSDSGASSARYPLSDADTKIEELEKLRRKAEQDKAQYKVDVAERTQQELKNRRDLEAQVHSLEDKLRGQDDGTVPSNEKIQGLERALEETRRKLSEERQAIQSFEDLLTALREELEVQTNERDNLRDEVVPQLKARVEGLESQASDHEKLVYENTRMQQEIETLKNARRMQQDMQLQGQRQRFNSISEENDTVPMMRSLSRSNSLAKSPIDRAPKSGGLSRSNSLKGRSEQGDGLSIDRLKDVEEQRDALHKALKNLLERQEVQARNHAKLIKRLEAERDEALNGSPRRQAFHKEVRQLRQEVNSLRRRAEDAMEQKYQCEKGLGGLKLDLDRAQEETTSLRSLLEQNDIFVPEPSILTGGAKSGADTISLDRAYKDLRATHALSMARIDEMEKSGNNPLGPEAGETMAMLKRSISEAEQERDFALNQADDYRRQAKRLQQSESQHLDKQQSLVKQLNESATRMDELASQVQQQLQSNTALRQRLADAIGRGEEEQKSSANRINEMQSKLRSLEDKVMSAQQESEDALVSHELEVRDLKDAHNVQLQRMRGTASPNKSGAKSPLSPLFASRSPRLDKMSGGLGISVADSTRTERLEKRVRDLETALSNADQEMQEVVGRMNMAQMEVAELQSERDDAINKTRKLQVQIDAERQKVEDLMNKT